MRHESHGQTRGKLGRSTFEYPRLPGLNIRPRNLVHTGPDKFRTVLKFVGFRLAFTQDAWNRTNSRTANRRNLEPNKIRTRFVLEWLLNQTAPCFKTIFGTGVWTLETQDWPGTIGTGITGLTGSTGTTGFSGTT